ncbi:hypothetical protein [Flavilitoribacter nigricans]|uniref:Uncharacterized protein n=1 Tax=Flavilitoribacter nigricans (strain ATCC 23147 / DSM 23189 / NBRC 102662 / NCIMB 1420 / SS-2) TaxID=1122177 RepID=A0A2D0N208_FLAN2|nr:hypothetical protein [Flavilitoribacter nigricans]PHN02544.1 hypothetical protein CRP01_31710 [Flavilitoribacter nigricans DSM 23189 = NBRC 102662]
MYVLGIGLNSDGFSSYVEGVWGVYAMMFFVLIHLTCAKLIGQEKPSFGLFLYLFGLMGACGGVFATAYRVVIGSLDKSGLPAETMARYMTERETHWEMLVMAPATLALPLSSILIGIGLIRLRSVPVKPYIGPVLILAGIAFLLAQGTETDWGLHYFYPLAGLCWVLAYGSLGAYYLETLRSGNVQL